MSDPVDDPRILLTLIVAVGIKLFGHNLDRW